VRNETEAIVVCFPVADMPEPPMVSTAVECYECGRPVWLSPTTLARAQADHGAGKVSPWCIQCAIDSSPPAIGLTLANTWREIREGA
jgi:hypothetical protein